MGANTKARVYKLIADSYLQKKDTAAAKEFVDQYFAKVKPEELTAIDYQMKAAAYSIIPGQEEVVYNAYVEGLKVDTVLENKIDLLEKGAAFFKAKGHAGEGRRPAGSKGCIETKAFHQRSF